MALNYIAIGFLLLACLFAYRMRSYALRDNTIPLMCADVCVAVYILSMLICGDDFLETALGIAVLAIAVTALKEYGENKSCCLTPLHF